MQEHFGSDMIAFAVNESPYLPLIANVCGITHGKLAAAY